MPTTSNFGWTTPADTDLVKDGAAAIRTLGNGIDTSFLDLKGGTTGQILSKASNSDLDYAWINNDQGDITEVVAGTGLSGGGSSGSVTLTNTVATAFDAAGDLVYGTGADTFTKLSLGTAGQVLTVNSGATAPEWKTATSGGYTELASGSLSSTAVNITGLATTYRDLVLVVRTFQTDTDGSLMQLRVNADSGANRYSTNTTFGDTTSGAFNAAQWAISREQDDTVSTSLIYVRLYDYANSSTWKMGSTWGMTVSSTDTAQYRLRAGTLVYNQTTAISQLNILRDTGTFDGGTYVVYGVK